jgi:hypothetical protein
LKSIRFIHALLAFLGNALVPKRLGAAQADAAHAPRPGQRGAAGGKKSAAHREARARGGRNGAHAPLQTAGLPGKPLNTR